VAEDFGYQYDKLLSDGVASIPGSYPGTSVEEYLEEESNGIYLAPSKNALFGFADASMSRLAQ